MVKDKIVIANHIVKSDIKKSFILSEFQILHRYMSEILHLRRKPPNNQLSRNLLEYIYFICKPMDMIVFAE